MSHRNNNLPTDKTSKIASIHTGCSCKVCTMETSCAMHCGICRCLVQLLSCWAL